jgi:hypothetical protein
MTDDAFRFTPTARVLEADADPRDPDVARRLLDLGYLVLHEGKTFRQYDDHWAERPRYILSIQSLADKPAWLRGAAFYRAAYRNIAGPGDENVSIWTLYCPPTAAGETGRVEGVAWERPTNRALQIIGVFNSYLPDWLLQLRVRSHVNKFMLYSTPFPAIDEFPGRRRFIVHLALRLSCNHPGYAPLWREQLGDTWREPQPKAAWPVLATDNERWAVRAAIDAVVAEAYGLNREQYEHVLSAFSHKSYPQAPRLCLERFDELTATGLDAFTRKHDPYWDVPLNESLPEPVIDIPLPVDGVRESQPELFYRPVIEDQPLRKAAEGEPPYRAGRPANGSRGKSPAPRSRRPRRT